MEHQSSLKLNPIKSSLASCSKPNLWNSSTTDPPTFLKCCRHTLHHLQRSFSVASALDVTSLIKGAFPDHRVQQGLDQLIHLYTFAGFPNEELHTISSQILNLHQNLQQHEKMCSLPVSGLLMSGWFCSLLWFLSLFCLVQRWSSRLVSGLKLVYPTSRLTPLTPLTIMDSPHGREIHYHLARALIFEQHRRFSSLFRTCCRLG